MSIALELIAPEDRLRIDGESAQRQNHPEDDPTRLAVSWREFKAAGSLLASAGVGAIFRQEDVDLRIANRERCALAAATLYKLIVDGDADMSWKRLADFLNRAATRAKGAQAVG